MDTKSKNKDKKGMLYVLLTVLTAAAITFSCYPLIQQRAQLQVRAEEPEPQEETMDSAYGSSYVEELYKSGFVLYEELCRKRADGPGSREEIFLPEADLGRLDAEEQEWLREALDQMMENAWRGFQNFFTANDYYAKDLAAGNEESNVADGREEIRAYVDNQKWEDTSRLDALYDAWLCLQYEENGDIAILGSKGVDTENFYRLLQRQKHRNLLEEWDSSLEGEVEMSRPKSMQVFYGFTISEEHGDWEHFITMYSYYNDSLLWIYGGMLAFVGILALLFRRREAYRLNRSALFRTPLEVSVIALCMVFALYGPMLEMVVVFMEGHVSMGPQSDFLSVLGNYGAWSALYLAWFWVIGCLAPVFRMGPWEYVKRYSLIYRFFPFIKRQWKRFVHYAKDVDLTEHMERSIWKVVLINGAVIAILCTMWFGGLVGVIVYSVFLFFFLRKYFTEVRGQYQALLSWVREMAGGNLSARMDADAGIFEPIRRELSEIQTGFQRAVDEEVKSQKMKTELITNVSHDLKTPLTAIITYVDLLKNEELSEEERMSYIRILEKKSMRLKVLIEDLFEVSKATSNNVTLNITDVDIVNLLKQVRFEMEDKLSASGLDFRWNLPEEKIVLPLDSQKTYRVFENLLGNILKYALSGSRVYIDLRRNESGRTVITMKNISATELNFDPKEITERFVRGDLSRNTEGSGLGLAIARSFTELQGGVLDIEIDGDLFKAIVVF